MCVCGGGGGEEGVMSLFYARILYLYIFKSYQHAQMGVPRHKETRSGETRPQADRQTDRQKRQDTLIQSFQSQ